MTGSGYPIVQTTSGYRATAYPPLTEAERKFCCLETIEAETLEQVETIVAAEQVKRGLLHRARELGARRLAEG